MLYTSSTSCDRMAREGSNRSSWLAAIAETLPLRPHCAGCVASPGVPDEL